MNRQERLDAPMLIPDAPSASAATNPRLSAMPPEARYGTFSSCAARASCVTSVHESTDHEDLFSSTYQYQPWNILLARMPSACVNYVRRFSRVRCSSFNTHSRPSILRISTPSFSADYIAVFSVRDSDFCRGPPHLCVPDSRAFVYDNTSLTLQICNQLLRCAHKSRKCQPPYRYQRGVELRTIVPSSFEDAHALGNCYASESLVVRRVDGRE